MAPVLGPEHIILNHATIAPKETLEAARLVGERHANYLDAPFTGSRDAAEAGQIVFYIGGEIGVLDRARPQLEVNAKAILVIGEIGQAAAIKIATNLMAAVAVGSFAEAMCLLEKSGVPLYKLGEALEHHAAHSPLVDLKMPAMITADFDPRFSLKHMFKDVQIALSMARGVWRRIAGNCRFRGRGDGRDPKGLGRSRLLQYCPALRLSQSGQYTSRNDLRLRKSKTWGKRRRARRRRRRRRDFFLWTPVVSFVLEEQRACLRMRTA